MQSSAAMRSKTFFTFLVIGMIPAALTLSACSDDAEPGPDPNPPADAGPDDDGGAGGEGGQGGDPGDAGDGGDGGSGGDDGDAGDGGDDGGDGGDGGAGGDGGDGDPVGCERLPGPADADRIVVTGHKYGDDAPSYQVIHLASDGTLSVPGKRFTMGKPGSQPIVFTPDGKLGFAPQDDGTLGVFRVNDDGDIEVLHEDFGKGEFYVGQVVMAPSGDHLYGLDSNWPNNGGGIYRIDIDCDDTLTIQPRLIEGKNMGGMAFLSPTEALVTTRELGPDTQVGESVHRLSLTDPPSVLASLNLFGDDDAIFSALALTRDKKFAIVGDNNEYTGNPTRVGFVGITDDGLVGKGVSSDVNDPVGVVASPFDDAIIVASGYGNRVFIFDYDPTDADTPFTFRGELEDARPQLPGAPVSIERGALDGRVFLPVVNGIYQVQFAEGGEVEDLGVFSVGESMSGMVSNLGVQP